MKRRYDAMNIYQFIWIGFICVNADVEVTGELSFDIRILNVDNIIKDTYRTVMKIDGKGSGEEGGREEEGREEEETEEEGRDKEEREVVGRKEEGREDKGREDRANRLGVTAPALVECAYQYPEKEQFDAVLSDMMNQLTKIFVRAHDLIQDGARRGPTRFRVVPKLDSSFFEKAFAQMAKEFRQFYNATISTLNREEDPCENQEKIKEVWQKLLDHSQKSLERAGLLCVEEFLRTRNRADDSKARIKLDKLAKKELGHIRPNLLDKLCDDFQLCYNELL